MIYLEGMMPNLKPLGLLKIKLLSPSLIIGNSNLVAMRSFLTCVQITKLHIIGIIENICNMKKEGSNWILKLNIVDNGDKLHAG